MEKKFAILQQIDGDPTITSEKDYTFLYILQNGLLLALKEQDILSETQCRSAEKQLLEQQYDHVRRRLQQRGENYS